MEDPRPSTFRAQLEEQIRQAFVRLLPKRETHDALCRGIRLLEELKKVIENRAYRPSLEDQRALELSGLCSWSLCRGTTRPRCQVLDSFYLPELIIAKIAELRDRLTNRSGLLAAS